MDKLNEEIETVPHDLDAYARRRRVQTEEKTFASTMANFFRRNRCTNAPESTVPDVVEHEETAPKSTFYEHWDAIRADGITASQFMAFLQPLADLDGMTVSYIYGDEDGQGHRAMS